jgi:3-methyladenine DNA glycosylase Tag
LACRDLLSGGFEGRRGAHAIIHFEGARTTAKVGINRANKVLKPMPGWKAVAPKNDQGYFDLMSRAIFTAGLNWRMVENKWPHFQKAFRGFSPEKVAKLSERDISALMQDSGIVRNEKKIRATVENAKTILDLAKEYGSLKGYIDGFGKREGKLLEDLQYKFKHMGPATARVFLWTVGYPLTPTKEEKQWMKGHPEHH